MAERTYKIPMVSPWVDFYRANKGGWLGYRGYWRQISQTEAFILYMCDGTRTVEEIAHEVADVYGEPAERVQLDVETFLGYLSRGGPLVYLPEKLSDPLTILQESDVVFVPDTEAADFSSDYVNQVGLVLTNFCPMRCTYCFANAAAGQDALFLPRGKALEVVNDAGKMKAKRVVLTGGDPLAHPDIVDIVNAVCETGLEPSLSTKALLLTPERAPVNRCVKVF